MEMGENSTPTPPKTDEPMVTKLGVGEDIRDPYL